MHSATLPTTSTRTCTVSTSPRGLVGFAESRYVVQASSSIRSHLTYQTKQSDGPRKKKNKKQLLEEPKELSRNTRAQWVREMGLQ